MPFMIFMVKTRKANMSRTFSDLSHRVIGCAIEVHKHLGPGLLESAYQRCLAHELHLNNIPFETEAPLPIEYKGARLDCGYRMDILVDNEIILELKSVEAPASHPRGPDSFVHETRISPVWLPDQFQCSNPQERPQKFHPMTFINFMPFMVNT